MYALLFCDENTASLLLSLYKFYTAFSTLNTSCINLHKHNSKHLHIRGELVGIYQSINQNLMSPVRKVQPAHESF